VSVLAPLYIMSWRLSEHGTIKQLDSHNDDSDDDKHAFVSCDKVVISEAVL